jgi:hypothetical protein
METGGLDEDTGAVKERADEETCDGAEEVMVAVG